jgi:hypothetical protein
MRHRLAVLLLLLRCSSLSLGSRRPRDELRGGKRAASSVPEIADLLSHPTVKSTAEYQASDDEGECLSGRASRE